MARKVLKYVYLILTIVALWFGAWGLLDEATDTLEEKHGVPKTHTYTAVLAIAALFLLIRPEILNRF